VDRLPLVKSFSLGNIHGLLCMKKDFL